MVLSLEKNFVFFIWPIDGTLANTTAMDQSGTEINGNDWALHIPQSFRGFSLMIRWFSAISIFESIYNPTCEWTQISWAIGEHSTHNTIRPVTMI